MPRPAPGAERVAGGVEGDAVPAASARPRDDRAWRWAGVALFLLLVVVLFDAYLHLSKTYPENSDEANILLMANDMLHGNLYLTGWHVSDVPFISTELPQIALLVWLFGLHLNTAHIAAAVTYTLIVAVGMLLAKGRARGPRAVTRMALALAIMLAPQPGVGVFVLIFSVGHIGAALPVLLTWLVLDRFGWSPAGDVSPRRRWWVPLVIAVLLGWALMADPLVLVIAIFPMLAVCLVRVVTGLVPAVREAGSVRGGLRRGLASRWVEFSLAAAAGLGYLIVVVGRQLLQNAGGYYQHPIPYKLNEGFGRWFMQARVVVHGLLEMFGAYFVPGKAINYLKPGQYVVNADLSGLDQAIAITRLAGVLMVIWAAVAIIRRFFRRDADLISQLLFAGIVANLAAYIPSTLADFTALNTREIAPVLPFAAVLAGRMLGDRILAGPRFTVRLPAVKLPAVRVRLVAVPLVALLGWYSFGLFREATIPAAPNPFTQLEAFLEANHLSYGLGGYWEASAITVDTGGAVTIRAVTPNCMQPYEWESKQEWYDPATHVANFLLISNVPIFFSQFKPAVGVLGLLNQWNYPRGTNQVRLDTGGMYMAPLRVQRNGRTVYALEPVPAFEARVYPVNLLAQAPALKAALNNAPPGPLNPHPKPNACAQKP